LFHHRCAIDHNIRIGKWFQADIRGREMLDIQPIRNKAPPHLKILAFDIETEFELTREPNPNKDEISMICMFTGEENTLLVNAKVVETKNVRDIDILLQPNDPDHIKPWVDWAYSKASNDYSSVLEHFFVKVIIVKTEKELLTHFYNKISEFQPDVIADFFGGRFDIPFIAVRSEKYNISLEKQTGFKIVFKNQGRGKRIERKDLNKRYTPASLDYVEGAGIIHLDAWLFNEKYSYLPKKDLGLKPSVEKKLKIIPIGREALFSINEKPEEAVAYAGCDGYITWKYVQEIVLEFFLSLGQMFPVPASELLARRAGSLDDLLIDAEDHKHGIIGKRKIQTPDITSFSDRISIDSLAYTGGLVEAKRPGIFRSDIYYDYKPNKTALKEFSGIIQKIIRNESKSLARKVVKEEYEKRLIDEIGGVKVEYSGDPVSFLKNIETELLKNGISRDKRVGKLDHIRSILEESSSIYVEGIDEVVDDIVSKINQLSKITGETQLRGVHVDVTSMYPSQIRQYKLQPSGIVPLTKCRTCELYESDNSCFFEGDWVIKLTSRRPCRFKEKESDKCDPSICTSNKEAKCKDYEPISIGIGNCQEVFKYNKKATKAFRLNNNGKLENIPLEHTYLGNSTKNDPYASVQHWLINSVNATQISTKLDKNQFDIFEDQPEDFILPPNTFMSIDVRSKKITVLLSVSSRVCQKSYNFVARIMDDFFNTRIRHKFEAQRLKQLISQKNTRKQPVSAELLRQQKFHDSTQLGMKVPLNSIYGLLGMKAGVRNASTPCAGITTKLSADLIHWAAEELEKIGLVTELDTDGVWLWVPKLFPLTFPVTIVNPSNKDESRVINVSLIDKMLNEKVDSVSRNDNYWNNDGHRIIRSSKSLITFEQDGPYDFQFVMGKKKYIVYNYDKK
ncbi:MAG: 3'-5' exonuclease, partial [Candidatus Hodarchaeales archaeon]